MRKSLGADQSQLQLFHDEQNGFIENVVLSQPAQPQSSSARIFSFCKEKHSREIQADLVITKRVLSLLEQ